MLYNESGFYESLPASFDGKFEWDWMRGCFPRPSIMPADIDAIVEVKGKFLIFETKKHKGVEIPNGQQYTLRALYNTGLFTIVIMYGKTVVDDFTFYYPDGRQVKGNGVEEARKCLVDWSHYAEPSFH